MAARPGMGKTAIALDVAKNASQRGFPVSIFSLEMSKNQLANRVFAGESGVNGLKFRSGKFLEDDWEKITRAGGKLYNLPIRIDDTGALTYTEIRRRARQHVKRYDTRLVIVDHLHITHGEKNQNRDREIGSITAGLKSAAKELNIPILLLAQLNRQLEMRQDKRPKLSDLRDSGNIEQDADMVMFLYRPAFYGDAEDYSGHTELCLAKQRDGPTGLVKLVWNEKTTTFQSLETRNLL